MRKSISFLVALLSFGLSLQAQFSHEIQGQPDLNFGVDGAVLFPISGRNSAVTSVEVQNDGKILVCGYSLPLNFNSQERSHFFIARLLSNGTLDLEFGDGGKRIFEEMGSYVYEETNLIGLQSDGKIVIAYNFQSHPDHRRTIGVSRLLENGEIDMTFGSNGTHHLSAEENETLGIKCLKILPDDSILLAGKSFTWSDDLLVVKLKPDGAPDETFGNIGFFRKNIGATPNSNTFTQDCVNDLLILPDGRIILGGYRGLSMYADGFVAALTASGDFIEDFGAADAGGYYYLTSVESSRVVERLWIAANDRIRVMSNSFGHISEGYAMYLTTLTFEGELDMLYANGNQFHDYSQTQYNPYIYDGIENNTGLWTFVGADYALNSSLFYTVDNSLNYPNTVYTIPQDFENYVSDGADELKRLSKRLDGGFLIAGQRKIGTENQGLLLGFKNPNLGWIEDNQIAYHLYPNPFKNQIELQLTENLEDVLLLDSSGRSLPINWEKLENFRYLVRTRGEVASGVYFVQLRFSGKKQTVKVVKQ